MCDPGELLSTTEAAAMLGISVHGLTARRRAGTVASLQFGGTHLYRRSDIERQPLPVPGRKRGPKPRQADAVA